jgi:hypothetical protein
MVEVRISISADLGLSRLSRLTSKLQWIDHDEPFWLNRDDKPP